MTVEYLALGGILIVMGLVQIWLRHGAGAKDLRAQRPTGVARGGRAWNAWTAILGGVGIVVGVVLVVLGALGR